MLKRRHILRAACWNAFAVPIDEAQYTATAVLGSLCVILRLLKLAGTSREEMFKLSIFFKFLIGDEEEDEEGRLKQGGLCSGHI